jgi:hypothetical protein
LPRQGHRIASDEVTESNAEKVAVDSETFLFILRAFVFLGFLSPIWETMSVSSLFEAQCGALQLIGDFVPAQHLPSYCEIFEFNSPYIGGDQEEGVGKLIHDLASFRMRGVDTALKGLVLELETGEAENVTLQLGRLRCSGPSTEGSSQKGD